MHCLVPNFYIHVSVSDLHIIYQDQSAYLAAAKWADRPILGIFKSLTDK
jgi:hypothetical protein